MLFAYLDPGTGSVIVQAIIGGIVGVGIIVKTYWHKIRRLFGNKASDNEGDLRAKSTAKSSSKSKKQ